MGLNSLIIDVQKENIVKLEEALNRFKDTYRVEFDFFNENDKFEINLTNLDSDLVFLIGYYYGALQFIEKHQKGL